MSDIFDWSTTAGSNTTVDGVNIAEGCPAGNVNNGMRAMMATIRNSFALALKTFLNGTAALPVANGGTAATTASAARTNLGLGSMATASTGDYLTTAAFSSALVGAVLDFAMSTPPSGWLECDGSAVSRATYAALFTAIGTTFGSGDGSTTFNLPDLRGRFRRGYDHGAGVDSGRTFGSTQAVAGDVPITGYGTSGLSPGPSVSVSSGRLVVGSGAVEISETLESLRAAGNTVTLTGDVRPVNVALLTCIKY